MTTSAATVAAASSAVTSAACSRPSEKATMRPWCTPPATTGTAARLPAPPGDSGSGTTPAGTRSTRQRPLVADVARREHARDVRRRSRHRLHPAVRRRRRDDPAEHADQLVGHLLQPTAVDDDLHEGAVDLLRPGGRRRPPARLRWHLSRSPRQIVGNISHAAGG